MTAGCAPLSRPTGPGDLPDLPIQDRDDAAIVAAAIAAGAQVLVTGDHELQSLKNIAQLRIISPRAFWEELTALK